ncbi:uncharacterized protein MONBRDRAFT_13883 [Monosiga brevicollis MX1]|uniref:Thymidylate kinase n=1 Tax=Monosiga brevicollis TaxID=81824 RepID=A9UNQ0_MONBE|nr:uncharacterized protein MONBRDRAFT_13883 [Monosiga brevicollis MX1]EDQ92738.1 predicted protein [Monosiga brevicollis MX1]|eukprot:XP_001742500.1 hypothetical protein [Monosiga brevicollis MX1]
MNRGLLIVLEGCDRCGKSTQCGRLVEWLKNHRPNGAESMRFPDRTTQIGSLINQYLRKEIELPDKAAHLLFSANRWELRDEIERKLANGVSLVVDRYAFSGVAFTSAKGLDVEWCKQPDAGLPVPDVLIHMELSQSEAESRGGFGEERYEVSEFQAKVKEQVSLVCPRRQS